MEGPRCSIYRGVTWCRSERMWRARIYVNNTQLHVGRYETEELAGEAYDCAALLLRGGQFAANFGAAHARKRLPVFQSCHSFSLQVAAAMAGVSRARRVRKTGPAGGGRGGGGAQRAATAQVCPRCGGNCGGLAGACLVGPQQESAAGAPGSPSKAGSDSPSVGASMASAAAQEAAGAPAPAPAAAAAPAAGAGCGLPAAGAQPRAAGRPQAALVPPSACCGHTQPQAAGGLVPALGPLPSPPSVVQAAAAPRAAAADPGEPEATGPRHSTARRAGEVGPAAGPAAAGPRGLEWWEAIGRRVQELRAAHAGERAALLQRQERPAGAAGEVSGDERQQQLRRLELAHADQARQLARALSTELAACSPATATPQPTPPVAPWGAPRPNAPAPLLGVLPLLLPRGAAAALPLHRERGGHGGTPMQGGTPKQGDTLVLGPPPPVGAAAVPGPQLGAGLVAGGSWDPLDCTPCGGDGGGYGGAGGALPRGGDLCGYSVAACLVHAAAAGA
ncbi:MAG: hypothetical protein J3K34DRAFT_522450, partial [Monoraphidium minutum]